MAKQIIILERQGSTSFSVAFWLSVPVARQPYYANASATSKYKDATTAELQAIQSGSIVEQIENYSSDLANNLAALKAILQADFNSRQSTITNSNPWLRYGSFYDGAAWTAGGVV